MSGKEILVDTNIVLYLLNGSDTLETILQGKTIHLSFITELELVGFRNITDKEEQQIADLLIECTIVSLNNRIKEKYIEIRRKYHLKLADAIIAATSLVLDIPLISADKQFKTVKELNLITYQHNTGIN
ncbi:MAG: type toxin-antitoxin system VapC family toxin [Mucilaginibacter sp.]|nr:type toxin-antitoxin system VapC family toxin [Mucilaginibacter sp.]